MDNMLEINNRSQERNFNLSIIESMDLKGIQDKLNKINMFHEIVKATLIPEIDYGVIPGTTKPMLFKSGAENILMLFGLITNVDIITAVPLHLTRDTDFVSYTVKCRLLKDGEIVSEGMGTCNSGEKKYLKADALDVANTIMKMASKRALVDAVLHVASLSAVFAEEAGEITDYLNKESMENLSVAEASTYKITFGKHKGKTAGEIYRNDADYVKWFFRDGKDEKTKRAFEVLSEAVKAQAEQSKNAAKKAKENIAEDGVGDNGIDTSNTGCDDVGGESLGELSTDDVEA